MDSFSSPVTIPFACGFGVLNVVFEPFLFILGHGHLGRLVTTIDSVKFLALSQHDGNGAWSATAYGETLLPENAAISSGKSSPRWASDISPCGRRLPTAYFPEYVASNASKWRAFFG
jgi:hypothetical protein